MWHTAWLNVGSRARKSSKLRGPRTLHPGDVVNHGRRGPELRVAALNVAQTQAQYRIQRAALFPQISGFADSSSTRTPASLSSTGHAAVTHDYSVGVSASWEIDFFGRLQSLSDQALQQYFATAQARKAAQILLVGAEFTEVYSRRYGSRREDAAG